MGGTGCKVKEERRVRRQGVVILHPIDSFVGQVMVEVVALFWRHGRINWGPVFIQGGIKLISFSPNKPIEIVKTKVIGPAIERPQGTGLIVRHVVVLAKPAGGIAVGLQDLADGCRALGN